MMAWKNKQIMAGSREEKEEGSIEKIIIRWRSDFLLVDLVPLSINLQLLIIVFFFVLPQNIVPDYIFSYSFCPNDPNPSPNPNITKLGQNLCVTTFWGTMSWGRNVLCDTFWCTSWQFKCLFIQKDNQFTGFLFPPREPLCLITKSGNTDSVSVKSSSLKFFDNMWGIPSKLSVEGNKSCLSLPISTI